MTSFYQSLNKDEKINIFTKCQSFLMENHPQSEFLVRRSFLSNPRSKYIETLIKLYKEFNGNVYLDKNCIIFFKIFDIKNGLEDVYKKYNNPSDSNGNTIFIVFATFNSQKINIKNLIETELGDEIKQICFSRGGKFKIYKLDKFCKKFQFRDSSLFTKNLTSSERIMSSFENSKV